MQGKETKSNMSNLKEEVRAGLLGTFKQRPKEGNLWEIRCRPRKQQVQRP